MIEVHELAKTYHVGDHVVNALKGVSMKVSAATSRAMPWAASWTVPIQPIISAEAWKSPPSASPVSHGGGITPLKKIFDYAAVYQIKSGVHGPTDVSPIGHAASATTTNVNPSAAAM